MTRVLHRDSVWPGENFLVCSTNKNGEEIIHQSERDDHRADHAVETLNEHETNHARRARYYWREVKPGEVIPRGEKHYLA